MQAYVETYNQSMNGREAICMAQDGSPLTPAQEKVMDRRDQKNFNIALHKFFSPHELYAHFPSPCPPDCAGKIPLPTTPPVPVAAPAAPPTCPTPACLIPENLVPFQDFQNSPSFLHLPLHDLPPKPPRGDLEAAQLRLESPPR